MSHDGADKDDQGLSTTGPTQAGEDQREDVPNPESGVGVGASEPSSFEPEEDPEATGS